MTRMTVGLLVVSGISIVLASACGGGDNTTTGVSITGTVTYAGNQDGSLTVGLFKICPPITFPFKMIMTKIETPVFPQQYEIEGLTDTGEFYVAATYDVGKNNPTIPGAEDLIDCSAKFTLTAEQGAVADVVLHDN